MRNLNDAGRSSIELGPAAVGMLLGTHGFTSGDLKLLKEAHQTGVAHRGWGRAQLASNYFSHYLAIWDGARAEHEPPTLVIVRFINTGTYALLVRGKIVTSGKTLDAILPALAIAGSPAEQEA